jgi:hypothetical protein
MWPITLKMEGFALIPTWVLWIALFYGFVLLGSICTLLSSINDEAKKATTFLAMLAKR